jgi:hypothetical protein
LWCEEAKTSIQTALCKIVILTTASPRIDMADTEKTDAVATTNLAEADATLRERALEKKYALRQHWKCLAACTLVSMCPFQYGIDFGIVGGLQAMVGFLQVSSSSGFAPFSLPVFQYRA